MPSTVLGHLKRKVACPFWSASVSTSGQCTCPALSLLGPVPTFQLLTSQAQSSFTQANQNYCTHTLMSLNVHPGLLLDRHACLTFLLWKWGKHGSIFCGFIDKCVCCLSHVRSSTLCQHHRAMIPFEDFPMLATYLLHETLHKFELNAVVELRETILQQLQRYKIWCISSNTKHHLNRIHEKDEVLWIIYILAILIRFMGFGRG